MATASPLVRIAELEIDPGQLTAYRAALIREIEASLANEPGVLALEAVADPDAPHRIRLFEVYASEAAYEAHLKSPHFLAYKVETAGAVLSLCLTPVDAVRVRARPLDF